ncbi:MAG: acetolactate synthase small subunit [Caldilineaceae bacterium]|nr:acetolactate synthase small subunit [Caldilineaceae bacterium]MCB9136890.1 acetolactate synthase small subunit [Caldilineaceae bacterium]
MKYTLVAWMRDKPGVLNRVSGMMRRRNFNIDSLQVGRSETEGISRMTFVVDGNDRMVDQVIKQLRKVVDITRVEDITHRPSVVRELALIRVAVTADNRSEIVQIVNIYRGEIVDVSLESMVVQIVGSEDRVDGLIGLLENFGILEMVRTGRVALVRGTVNRRLTNTTAVWKASANGQYSEAGRQTTGGV